MKWGWWPLAFIFSLGGGAPFPGELLEKALVGEAGTVGGWRGRLGFSGVR